MIRTLLRTTAAVILVSGCGVLHRTPPEPINTVELPLGSDGAADSLLVDVQRVDTSIVVEMRYATTNNFTKARLPGYEGNHAYLRNEAAAALALVNEDLHRQGYGLKIFDAYRPVRATDAMVKWTQAMNRGDLLRDGYIASRSRHNLGVAVDLTVIDMRTKGELNMGTPFDYFGLAAHTNNARGVILKNRLLLKTVMERQGFTNYESEWWHFSYPVENPLRFDVVVR
ncbi:MAG TPA: M15 family metallopeptidase [Gemmatimonadaceae bacterium]|nr:M15 family metallopeptidase [Gemmatimonadaceae bacterium]